MIDKFAASQRPGPTTRPPGFSRIPNVHRILYAPHDDLLPFLFHCQVEALLASEDYGKDLASVNNLLKKHQLLEADISAHEVIRGGGQALLGTQLCLTPQGNLLHLGKERGVPPFQPRSQT